MKSHFSSYMKLQEYSYELVNTLFDIISGENAVSQPMEIAK